MISLEFTTRILGVIAPTLMAIAVLFAISTVFGRHRSIGLLSLLGGWALLFGAIVTGTFSSSLSTVIGNDGGAATGSLLFNAWTRSGMSRSWWTYMAAPSLIFSGAAILRYLDWRNSVLRKIDRAEPAAAVHVAPWTRFRINQRLRANTPLSDSVVLGVDVTNAKSVELEQFVLTMHMVIVGRSGSGKTTTLLRMVRYAIQKRIPIIWLDGKGDTLAQFTTLKRLADLNQRPIFRIDTNVPNESCHYDVLSGKDQSSRADCITALRNEWTEEHYELIASDYLQTIFATLDELGISPSLLDLQEYLNIRHLIQIIRRTCPDRTKKQQLLDNIERIAVNERIALESLGSSLRLQANATYSQIFDLRAAKESGKSILNLAEAREQGAIVYVCLNTLARSKADKRLAALIINDLKASLTRSRDLYLCVFDEFASFIGPQFDNIVNLGRSYGVCAVVCSQSLTDFKLATQPGFLDKLIGSVNTFVFHQLNLPEDADLAAGILGTITSVNHTAQTLDGQPNGLGSARPVHEYRVHPQVLKTLRVGEAVIGVKSNQTVTRAFIPERL